MIHVRGAQFLQNWQKQTVFVSFVLSWKHHPVMINAR